MAPMAKRQLTKQSKNEPGFDRGGIARARAVLDAHAAAIPEMAGFYKLLANPARVKALLVLGRIERMCVGDLAQVLGLSIAATSQQLRMLREGGWLGTVVEGKQVFYFLTELGLKVALEGDLRLLRKNAR